jgi:hypothetical protein
MWTVLSLPGAQVMLDLAKALASNLRPRRFGETLEHYVHTTTGPTAITQVTHPLAFPPLVSFRSTLPGRE